MVEPNLRRLRLGEGKKRKKKEETTGQKYNGEETKNDRMKI